jgi:hypothetical protein
MIGAGEREFKPRISRGGLMIEIEAVAVVKFVTAEPGQRGIPYSR